MLPSDWLICLVLKVLVHLGLSLWHRDPHADACVSVRVPLCHCEGPCVSVRDPGTLTLTQGPSRWRNGTLTLTQASAWGSLCQNESPRWTRTLTLIFIHGIILCLGKRLFELLEITFLEKTLYFAYLLTKRENLSHSEAKFICRFLLCMKWAWQASVATPFFKIKK